MSSNEIETQTSPVQERGFLAGFLRVLPIIQWALTVIVAIGLFVLSQRESQTVQAQDIRDTQKKVENLERDIDKQKSERDRQIEELKRTILTREVYDAYHNADTERMNRMEKMIERILENQNDGGK